MNDKMDKFEEIIKEELERDVALTDEKMTDFEGEMPEGAKERIHAALKAQIEDYEREQRYAQLSDEEREALHLGQEMLEKKKKVRTRRSRKVYLALAAVLILVVAIGVTSFGGAERIVAFMKSVVGEREVVKVNSSEDNLVIVNENEEEAYEAIKEEFGVEPVKIIRCLEGMKFQNMELDKARQIAELTYYYNNEKIIYLINASYRDSSWGIDIEDEVTDRYVIERQECLIKIKEYITPESKQTRYSANFEYLNLEYFIMGTVDKEEFDKIINKLYFYY
ncbi:DUF4367 domain-containing protein [Faecalicatena contorta]|uniref:DUF4367 domain-containing protein n=1 Tax=Faecalicatena contorta TaxID=39482 RepID=UPI001F2220B0|nr:DUF4367 domain-containing protein [Faecalicatena contorta]MCF2554700.1 DUF4367 domain-containing protein [Faecalicatena contorta]